jgi:cell division GTPase FtsZ
LDETAYVTVFPISERVKADYYIMNVVKTIVDPMTLDGLCGFDLADTKSILQKGKVGYGGFGIDRGGIEKAAIKAVDQLKRLYPSIESAVGGQVFIETGNEYSLNSLMGSLDIVNGAVGGYCEFYWQHRTTDTPLAPATVSLIAVYEL